MLFIKSMFVFGTEFGALVLLSDLKSEKPSDFLNPQFR